MLYRAAILVTLLSVAYCAVLADEGVDPAVVECVVGCSQCKLLKTCKLGYPQFQNCIATQVCENSGCVDKSNATSCICGGVPDGSYRDPYNPRFYYTCLMGQENYYGCPSHQIFSLTKQVCVDLPGCGLLGCFPIVDDCQSYYCCQKNGANYTQEVYNCNDGDFYNGYSGTCENITPTCSQSGVSADPLKCDVYHSCTGPDDTNPTSFCCPVGEKYDETTFNCKADDGSCSDVDICYDSYYEINYCNRCQSETDTFPSRSKCSPYYYGCVDTNPGFRQVLQECPAGYVFNPAGNFCDLPENVGC